MPLPADRFYVEVVKLLLQVAWGDERVDPCETLAIVGLAQSWGVQEVEVHALRSQLAAGKGLPPPDMGLLRSRADEVIDAARALAVADGRVVEAERELLEQIGGMLGGRAVPVPRMG